MAASYPGAIKNFLVLEDGVDKVIAAHPNDRGAEITAIETELGINPAGIYADVKSRLDATTAFGARVDKTSDYGAQQAATDGIVEMYCDGTTAQIYCYTDGNANPVFVVGAFMVTGLANSAGTIITFHVKKNDYWKIVRTSGTITQVSWIPIGV